MWYLNVHIWSAGKVATKWKKKAEIIHLKCNRMKISNSHVFSNEVVHIYFVVWKFLWCSLDLSFDYYGNSRASIWKYPTVKSRAISPLDILHLLVVEQNVDYIPNMCLGYISIASVLKCSLCKVSTNATYERHWDLLW